MKKEEIQENMPFTVVGHSHLPEPILSILLTGKGIQELAKRMDVDDMVRIEEWSDMTEECQKKRYHGKITIIKDTK